jgi:hypothetical protein
MARNITSMASNESHTLTDQFITRTHVMPILWNDELRAKITEEHRRNPVGVPGKAGQPAVQHSEELGHVLDKLRRHPTKGKEVKVAVEPFKKYAIGILPGVRGAPIEILEDKFYATEDECEHAIFLRRVDSILREYPKPGK